MIAVRWYLRFGLSYGEVEELLTEPGVRRSTTRQQRALTLSTAVTVLARPNLDSVPCDLAGCR